ncbi:hypothetical protein CFU_1744 [Collimonas fungivorans Ter331]|uniref:Uncharacterized protein n=1 Tax=Collimonas fungivorans (strain Ter331) TaxID=1005048 RepID=G0ABL0_COLFT|nr:hypothetical protein CFU_1744 [Collimonas fungivorans Ter331]
MIPAKAVCVSLFRFEREPEFTACISCMKRDLSAAPAVN